MTYSVCLRPTNTLSYYQGGGFLWVFLNWVSGLRAHNCRIVWLEEVTPDLSVEEVRAGVRALKEYLGPYGLADSVALYSSDLGPVPPEMANGCLDFDAATDVDVLINMRYDMHPEAVRRFRRTALIDIDPGLLQVWWSNGVIPVAPHDVYFTVGETVGQPGAPFPDCGVEWHYAPWPVSLTTWQPATAATPPDAPYTTVSGWWGGAEWLELNGVSFDNSKRASFLEYLDFPARTSARLELALCLSHADGGERQNLEEHGWRVRNAWEEITTPDRFKEYVHGSRGEFSCAKPSCMRLQNAWFSDRTLCYLAAGKPAVVQHTGPSRFLPNGEGFFRFQSMDEAARALSVVESDYDRQCKLARALAEEYFDATKVVGAVLERALS